MPTIIGEGEEAVKNFFEECIKAGGDPQVLYEFGPVNFAKKHELLVRCWGKAEEVPGGVIVDVPENLIKAAENASSGERARIIAEKLGIKNFPKRHGRRRTVWYGGTKPSAA